MRTIECTDLYGEIHNIPQEQVILRPAAYALVIQNGELLLVRMKSTGKYHLPGGGIEAGESTEETLVRELREETGIEIEVGRLVHFEEVFFYYNPSGRAYQGRHFYYLCMPKAGQVVAEDEVMDGSAERPSWVAIQNLSGEDFQILGNTILDLCRQATQTG